MVVISLTMLTTFIVILLYNQQRVKEWGAYIFADEPGIFAFMHHKDPPSHFHFRPRVTQGVGIWI